MVTEYNRRRELVLDELDRIESLSYAKPKGAFYVFPNFSSYEKSDELLAMYLSDLIVIPLCTNSFIFFLTSLMLLVFVL